LNTRVYSPSDISLSKLIEYLLQGKVLAIPTETVYGLAANAFDNAAVEKIFNLKNRPSNHPLIVHLAPPKLLEDTANFWEQHLSKWSHDVPPEAILLAQKFWPGPLTLVLKKAKNVSLKITGGQDTVALRVPNHPWTIALLQEFPNGLVAPSANKFGHVSPTSAQHVVDEFKSHALHEEMWIMDGGKCTVGIESTILDLSRIEEVGPVILRPGMILEQDICECLAVKALRKNDNTVRHSGGHLGHYAPRTPLIIKRVSELSEEDFSQERICVVSFLNIQGLEQKWAHHPVDWLAIPSDPHQLAKIMYELLRTLDKKNYKKIIFDQLSNESHWVGINDRLTRSSFGSGNINH
jgi:L-threonylcarbamoyladenylate synthase